MRSKNPETMDRIIKSVDKHYLANGSSPTIRQIAAELKIGASTVHKYLVDMAEKGMITYDGSTIKTTVTRKYSEQFAGAAILDNAISCGKPEYQEEHIEEYIQLPTALFGMGDFYILKASGDSMINAGIESGDTVVIKKQNTANIGDIVVALADGQNTLKTYAYSNELSRVMLKPENDKYEPIYPNELYIQGVAVNVIKSL
jgi:repressor LexA